MTEEESTMVGRECPIMAIVLQKKKRITVHEKYGERHLM